MSMMNPKQTDDQTARQAIAWMVLLRSGEASQNDYADYQRWRHENILNERACRRIEQTLGQFEPLLAALPNEPIRQALLSPSSRRKVLRQGAGVISTLSLSCLLLNQFYPLSPLLSDAKTATAQRQTISLHDGSALTLNARSAVNISVNERAPLRQIELLNGGIMADITQDTRRPFMITTPAGDIMALEASVNVRYESGGVHVGVLDNIIKITNRQGQSIRIDAGHGAWFNDRTLYRTAISPTAETAWLQGRLEVRDRPLSYVIHALRDYTPGIIRIDPAVSDLRVSGNFPLDNIHYTLDSLAQTMPIAVVHTTDYWIHIHAASYG